MGTFTYNEAIVGYKAMDWDQTCHRFKYEEGHTYKIDGELSFHSNGFHFCEDLQDTVESYKPKLSNIYAEVKGWGEVVRGYDEIAVSEIEIVRFLSMEEFVNMINDEDLTNQYDLYKKDPALLVASDNWRYREVAAELGLGLDKLINDEDWQVRSIVAKQGYGLDKLINDDDYFVRATVANQGYGLDRLVNDEHYYVRVVIAEQDYGLDSLINDPDEDVREAVAEQGYGLDKLINDEHWQVRAAVARQGYGLDILINDPDEDVREAVKDVLAK